jgi:hypothetical protein
MPCQERLLLCRGRPLRLVTIACTWLLASTADHKLVIEVPVMKTQPVCICKWIIDDENLRYSCLHVRRLSNPKMAAIGVCAPLKIRLVFFSIPIFLILAYLRDGRIRRRFEHACGLSKGMVSRRTALALRGVCVRLRV